MPQAISHQTGISQQAMSRLILRQIWLISAVTVLIVSLSLSYIYDIAVHWGYYGFDLDISPLRFMLSFPTVLIFCLFTKMSDDAAAFFCGLTIMTILCPMVVIYSFGGAPDSYFISTTLGYALIESFSRLKFKRPVLMQISRKSFVASLMLMVIFCILAMIAFGGMRYFSINIFNVYLYRSSAEDLLPSIMGYILSPVSKVVIPMGVVLGVYFKNRTIIVIFLVLTVVFFGLTHHKSVLFAPFMVLAFFIFLRRYNVQKSLFFFFSPIAVITLVELFYRMYTGKIDVWSGPFSTLITRRVFLLPANIDSNYIDFFSENGFVYWSNSRISLGTVDKVYDLSAPALIGNFTFGREDIWANTGFIGSGFSNLGTAGVAIYGMFIGLILAVLNAHGRALGQAFTTSAALIVVVSAIVSSDLVIVILTHGLAFLLICLSCMPSGKNHA